jgi:hypothetical protein
MRNPDFNALRDTMLAAGIAPRHATRATRELRDHYDDLVQERLANGEQDAVARDHAAEALGAMDAVVAAMSARRELKTWVYRYPRTAVIVYPLACLAALPAVPVIAGVTHAPQVARWGLSFLAAGAFTALLFLLLQLTITLS